MKMSRIGIVNFANFENYVYPKPRSAQISSLTSGIINFSD